jgi:hypothetical protein
MSCILVMRKAPIQRHAESMHLSTISATCALQHSSKGPQGASKSHSTLQVKIMYPIGDDVVHARHAQGTGSPNTFTQNRKRCLSWVATVVSAGAIQLALLAAPAQAADTTIGAALGEADSPAKLAGEWASIGAINNPDDAVAIGGLVLTYTKSTGWTDFVCNGFRPEAYVGFNGLPEPPEAIAYPIDPCI